MFLLRMAKPNPAKHPVIERKAQLLWYVVMN
jgi:hypothetical protein